MPGADFRATVVTRDDDTVIQMAGDVNRGAQEMLAATYTAASDGPGRLILDFHQVDYINSTGIALIVGLLGQARAAGRVVAAVGLTPHYRELFTITRLSDFMTIYDDQNAATAAGQ